MKLLESEGRDRGFIRPGDVLTPQAVFGIVRDMPYLRASSRRPESIIEEWRGTCSGKHYLLDRLFGELGYKTELIMCTHQFTSDNTIHFPDFLRKIVAEQPVTDVHTYLRLWTGSRWMDVDATWPKAAKELGMPVNTHFEIGVDTTIACDPIELLPVPQGVDLQTYKERLIEHYCGNEADLRNRFIEGLTCWLGDTSV